MGNDTPLLLRSWPNAILHLDGDAFFAGCEQSVHPELKGKPLVTGQERNIVASMSYEAKALGITRAVPIWQARKICPNLIVLPSDYETYSLLSKKMFAIMRRFTPVVEESSIDEGFADLKGLRRLHRTGYIQIAKTIRETIERELDISISAGLSLNKTLSKLAAKYKKPHGFTAVPGRVVHRFLQRIPVGEICGIGPNTTALLAKQGVFTAFQYALKPKAWVQKLLGKIGLELWEELHGELIYALNPEEKDSYDSISKTKTFTPPSEDYDYIRAQLFRNAESAFIKMRRYQLKTRRMVLYLRTQEFSTRATQIDFSRGIMQPMEAFEHMERMLQRIYRPNVLYRSTGVVLLNLQDDCEMQFELFEAPAKMIGMHDLAHAIDDINGKYGKHAVFAGTGTYLRKDKKTPKQLEGRHALPGRKTDLLPGETDRQRLKLPLWKIGV